jgi:cytochrome c551/c552
LKKYLNNNIFKLICYHPACYKVKYHKEYLSRRKMMRKYCALIFLVTLFLCASNLMAGDGDEKPVFQSLNCGICHKADTGKAYPSLKEIAGAYNGDKEKLEKYLKGNGEPIFNQEKGKSMERYIEKTKALSDDELKSLVDFILNHKE